MIEHSTTLRVRYAETDRMGYVYYGNYPSYFELGRVEWLRNLGIRYKDMEDSGTMLPVLHLEVKYIRPAKYDDLLRLVTRVSLLPSSRIHFEHELYNEEDTLITKGAVVLVFVNTTTGKPCGAPTYFLEKVQSFFKE